MTEDFDAEIVEYWAEGDWVYATLKVSQEAAADLQGHAVKLSLCDLSEMELGEDYTGGRDSWWA